MRWSWSLVLLLALALSGVAQDPQTPSADGEAAAGGPVLWRMPEKDQKKLEKLLFNYLHPGRKARQEMLEPLQKFVSKEIDGHSALEDVATLSDIAHNARIFNPKAGRKGKTEEISVGPEVHGFPGGFGTVKYELHLPKSYTDRQLWPLIFCLPDNKKWTDGAKYIEDVWTDASSKVADEFIIVVPTPRAKGDPWHRAESWGRAMIALRHVCGNFDATKGDGGPAVDLNRVFVDGSDMAAQAAARFPEIFAGAILRHADGTVPGGAPIRDVGGIAGLPAYCVVYPKRGVEQSFMEKLKAANGACAAESTEKDAVGDAVKMHLWMTGLGPRVTQPAEIQYTVYGAPYQRHYWINVLEFDGSVEPAADFSASADRAKNEVRIRTHGVTRFELFLNDALVDLSLETRIVVEEDGKEYEFLKVVPTRDLGALLEELVASNHPWRIYPVRFVVDVPALKVRIAKEQAAEEAKKASEAKGAADASVGKK